MKSFINKTFGEWAEVIDENLLLEALAKISIDNICPSSDLVFKAFSDCPLSKCRVLILGQDPYPQKGVATGIAFANNSEPLSPSLQVLKDAAIDFTRPHNLPIEFDNTLLSWEDQGVLLLNSALTCEIGRAGSHVMIWRPFIADFLSRISSTIDLIYVLLGAQARSFEPYLAKGSTILKCGHPAYYARTNKLFPSSLFQDINNILKEWYGRGIDWYREYNSQEGE